MSSIAVAAYDRQQSMDDDGNVQDRVQVTFEIETKELTEVIRATRQGDTDVPYKDLTISMLKQVYQHLTHNE